MHRLALLAAAAGLAAAPVRKAFQADLGRIRQSLAREARTAATAAGVVEFAERGDGPPVLVVHGAGGGFDQGLLIAEAFVGQGFRWIAPSRFGYLRSPLPADASPAAQADAFAALLDTLGIGRLAVVAMSGGVPPALQLALRHPARVSALVLLSSAPFAGAPAGTLDRPAPEWLYPAFFASDFPAWATRRVAPSLLLRIFDVRKDRPAAADPAERAFVQAALDAFLPASARAPGLANEGAALDPSSRYALEEVAAPTLIVHARDDGINPFMIAAHLAARIPGAAFMPVSAGGHLLIGHQREVRARLAAFLRAAETGGGG
ncbi:alpha/beta fold hydrolase [Faunimonas sp. B44]|uniref:alpha/beta fold hydrolase n=1 Tax=Faunimonas sp. B44 TaxID=3461493 RepID=UPI004043EC57